MELGFKVLVTLSIFLPAFAESAGGVQWTAPSGWTAQPSRPMRAATYEVPHATGDKDAGECAVFYFGPGQGGGTQANIDRWIGQFHQADGKPSKDRAKIYRESINGFQVTFVDLSGTYTGTGGPMSPTKIDKPGFRLLGAIVENKDGDLFVKFTAPTRTVTENEAKFNSFIRTFRRSR